MDQMQLYQQIILDHNKKPRNFGPLEGCTHSSEGFNPLCGDHLKVELAINESGVIESIQFQGEGCAISKASASLMTTAIKGKNTEEGLKIFEEFQKMMQGKKLTEEALATLGKIQVFQGVCRFPTRIKCANLSWHTLKAAIDRKDIISTES